MTPMEIALLITGVIIFVISFFLPDRAVAKSAKEKEQEQEEIRRIMEKELDGMKLRVNEATDDTIEYAMEKTERSLERLSNEKIMAVNEYSGTIMEEINKSHKEVMFLYDMLSDKQVDLKNTVRKAEATAKEVEKNLNVIPVSRGDREAFAEKSKEPVRTEAIEKPAKTSVKPAEKKNSADGNHNQRILELYQHGKSNVDIAKELNLGVGEVKLVIDLFKG
ncbi:MAG: DUF6115 domain-containing protein [Lachnospiraceae bacterium]